MSTPFVHHRQRRQKNSVRSLARHRRLALEALEGRRLLAAELGLDPPSPAVPSPYVFRFSDLSSATPPESAGLEPRSSSELTMNRARMQINLQTLEVWDATTQQLLDQVPLESMSEIVVIGSSEPDDLILDFQGGDFGVPIRYDGAGPTSGTGDQLTLTGGVAEHVEHRFDDASSGAVRLSGTTCNQEVQYTGLEPIVDGTVAVSRTFIYSGGDDNIVFSDDAVAGDDFNLLDSNLAEQIVFRNPTDSLTIIAGDGMDVVEILELDSSTTFATLDIQGDNGDDQILLQHLLATITATTLQGGAGNDLVEIGSPSGSLDTILSNVTVNGDGEAILPDLVESVTAKSVTATVSVTSGDRLVINDSGTAFASAYSVNATTVQRVGSPVINYATIEELELLTSSAPDTVTIADTNAAGFTAVSTGMGNDSVTITATGADSILILDTGSENDIVDVTSTGNASVTRVTMGTGQDDASIINTGMSSGLELIAGNDIDVITILTTGTQSVTSIGLGEGDDVANVRGTGAMSYTDIYAGQGNDTLNVSSDADGNRLDTDGNPMGNLDSLLGELCLDGNDHLLLPETAETVTAKGMSVTVTIPRGDQLNLSDESSITDNSYALTTNSLEKTGLPAIVFNAIESLIIETGSGNDTLSVAATVATTQTNLSTDGGNDVVQINSTGNNSFLTVDTGIGNDSISVANTGSASVTRLNTRSEDDDILIAMTGVQSGLSINSGTEADVVSLVGTGSQSVTELRLAAGDDIMNIRGTGDQSVTDLFAGSDNDTINVSSDADGDRLNPSGDPAGNLDGILGLLCVHGNGDAASPETIVSASAKGNVVTATIRRGDELNISDQASLTDNLYSLDPTQFQRSGNPAIIYNEVETLNIETGNGADSVAVSTTALRTTTSIRTYAGEDDLQIASTGNFSILIVDTGNHDDTINLSLSGEDSVTRLITGVGADDILVTTTGLRSGLDLESGDNDDLLTIATTGTQSVFAARLGNGNDIANVQGTGALSFTDIYAQANNDTINVASDADGDRTNTSGDPAGNLDGILGELCVDGDGNELLPDVTDSVTAKGNTITVTVPRGDELNLSDQASVSNHIYVLDVTEFQRVGTPIITFNAIDSLNVETGSGDDSFTVITTRAVSRTTISTEAGSDTIAVNTTGDNSIVEIDSGADNDSATIATTGRQSILGLDTAIGEDDIEVLTSGLESGLRIASGVDVDVVTIYSTGSDSAASIDLDTGDDIANIRGSGAGSTIELVAGAGNDTLNVTSTANGTRPTPHGDLSGHLDNLLGAICLDGDSHTSLGNLTDDASARQTDGDLVTVGVTIELGDTLNISDAGSALNNTYFTNATTIQRTSAVATGLITYETIEAVNWQTGSGDDTITVQSTPDATAFFLDANSGAATVNVQSTGVDSLLVITTDIENDAITVNQTGARSLVSVQTSAGADSITLGSIGDGAGIKANLGDDADQVNLNAETMPLMRTTNAVIHLSGGAGEDTFDVREVYLRTVVDLNGDADNDTFNLTADGSDPTGYLGRLNNDPGSPPADDAIAATRQLFLDGGSNGPATATVQQGASVTAAPNLQPVEETVPGVPVGDTINLVASSASGALDFRYAITGSSNGVFATTTPSNPRSTTGNEVFETNLVENINVIAGAADDLMTVSSDLAFDIIQTGQRISFNGGDGTDKFEVLGTLGNDRITVGDTGGDVEPFEIGDVEFLRIEGGDGDDQLVNRTSVTSVIDSQGGSDIVLGGAGRDLLTGGAGVDFLYGRGGNDVLFTDQDLGDDTSLTVDGEVIDGGSEDSIPLGDVCVQLGLDRIRNCEVLSDGGGIKDVLTWLRAIFVPPGSIGFQPLSPVLDPFVPAFPSPVALLGVTEPSKLPLVSPPPTIAPPPALSGNDPAGEVASAEEIAAEPLSTASPTDLISNYSWLDSVEVIMLSADPLDVNRDGLVSPMDALYVINKLAAVQHSAESESSWAVRLSKQTADVNRNGTIELRDALFVINYLAATPVTGASLPQSPIAQSRAGETGQVIAWRQSVDHAFNDSKDEFDWSAESNGDVGQLF